MSDNKNKNEPNTQLKRFLRILSKSKSTIFKFCEKSSKIWLTVGDKQYCFHTSTLQNAHQKSLIVVDEKMIGLTAIGRSHLKRMLNPDMPFIAQHANLTKSTVQIENSIRSVLKNDNESALNRLYSRKDKNGIAWLDHNEFQAGERFRADFEKAQLSPKISANWAASVAGKNRASGGANDISDFALDAKIRLEKSITALGPELSGVAMDVCCFLKGLEIVEKEKGWPPRSAKLLLKTALSTLVRHYGITTGAQIRQNRFWGADNYRPELFL